MSVTFDMTSVDGCYHCTQENLFLKEPYVSLLGKRCHCCFSWQTDVSVITLVLPYSQGGSNTLDTVLRKRPIC
jgi:hypothetical protein